MNALPVPFPKLARSALSAITALALGAVAIDTLAAPPGKPAEAYVFAGFGGPLNGAAGVDIATLQLPPGEYLLQAKFWYGTTDPTQNVLHCRFQHNGFTLRDIMTVEAESKLRMAVMVGAVVNDTRADLAVHVFCIGPPESFVQHVRMVATLAEVEIQCPTCPAP